MHTQVRIFLAIAITIIGINSVAFGQSPTPTPSSSPSPSPTAVLPPAQDGSLGSICPGDVSGWKYATQIENNAIAWSPSSTLRAGTLKDNLKSAFVLHAMKSASVANVPSGEDVYLGYQVAWEADKLLIWAPKVKIGNLNPSLSDRNWERQDMIQTMKEQGRRFVRDVACTPAAPTFNPTGASGTFCAEVSGSLKSLSDDSKGVPVPRGYAVVLGQNAVSEITNPAYNGAARTYNFRAVVSECVDSKTIAEVFCSGNSAIRVNRTVGKCLKPTDTTLAFDVWRDLLVAQSLDIPLPAPTSKVLPPGDRLSTDFPGGTRINGKLNLPTQLNPQKKAKQENKVGKNSLSTLGALHHLGLLSKEALVADMYSSGGEKWIDSDMNIFPVVEVTEYGVDYNNVYTGRSPSIRGLMIQCAYAAPGQAGSAAGECKDPVVIEGLNDVCADSNWVYERWINTGGKTPDANGNVYGIWIDEHRVYCPYGCADGRCKRNTATLGNSIERAGVCRVGTVAQAFQNLIDPQAEKKSRYKIGSPSTNGISLYDTSCVASPNSTNCLIAFQTVRDYCQGGYTGMGRPMDNYFCANGVVSVETVTPAIPNYQSDGYGCGACYGIGSPGSYCTGVAAPYVP